MKNDQSVYVSNAIYQIGKSKNWSSIAVLDTVNYFAKNGKILSAQDIQKIKNRADHIYSSNFPTDDDRKFDSPEVQLNYDIVKMFEKSGVIGSEYLGGRYSKLMEDLNVQSALNVTKDINLQRQKSLLNGVSSAEKVLNETYEIAANNPEFKDSVDNVFSNQFNSSLANSEVEIRTANADFDNFLKTNGILDASNKILTSNNELKSVINKKLKEIIDASNTNQTEVVEKIMRVGENVEDLQSKVDYLFEKIRNEKEEQDRIALQNWEDYSLQSILSLTTNIIGDAKLTKGVLAVADAAFQIKNLLTQYNSVQNMSTLGSIGLVSGYAGVALALYSSFNSQEQQNADSIILENLQKISEQIEEFRKQVMEGISILDKKIDAYFEITNDNLKSIIAYLQGIDIDLDNVGDSLKNLSLQINLYWKDLKTKLDYLINDDIEDLKSDIENFKSTFEREMTSDEFRSYILKVFQIYEESKKAVFTGNKNSISSYNQLSVELDNKESAELINLLRAFISSNSNYKLTKDRVNPDRLNICMNLLIKLALDNPVTFKEIKGTKYQELYTELKIQKKEIEEIRANKNDSLISIFKKLTADYLNSIKDFQKEIFQIYEDELVKYNPIKDKSKSNTIVDILETYQGLVDSFTLDFPGGIVSQNIRKAKELCAAFEFEHAQYSDWRKFINPSNGIIDFSVPEAAIEANPLYQYRGNSSFPKIGLTTTLIEEILLSCPSLVLLLTMDAIHINKFYYSSYVTFVRKPFSIPGYSGPPLESGYPIVYYRLLFDNEHLIAKPEMVSPVINYISPERIFHDGTTLPKLKDLVPFSYSWGYRLDTFGNFPEYQANIDKLNDSLFLIVKNYLLQNQEKVLSDLKNASTDLYQSVLKIETISKLLHVMINYIFEGINSDTLNYITGDIKRQIDIGTLSYLPLLNNEFIQLIISSLTIDKEDISGSLSGFEFNLFDNRFYEKCEETTDMIIKEIVNLNTNSKINSFLNMADNQFLFELIIASKS